MTVFTRLLGLLCLAATLSLSAPVWAAETYTPDPAFMSLFKVFPHGEDKSGIGATLADVMSTEAAQPGVVSPDGPLVIVNGSGIYAYDSKDRTLLLSVDTRNDPAK
ncbi:MAG: hypothetical protein O3A96_05575 [Proteobacteria bacterium]|nr:hypothetical protein [Pseudomonadota bacterium]